MKITQKILYRKHGVRKAMHFVRPPVGHWSEFAFPFMSTYHYVDNTGDNPFPDHRRHYLSYRPRVPLVNVTEYSSPIGRMKPINKYASLLSRNRGKLKKFTFLEPGETVTTNALVPIVYNYGLLPYAYRYAPNKINRYFEWRNTYRTLYETINRTALASGRNQYLFLDVPVNIPATAELRVISRKDITKRALDLLVTDQHLSLYDVWLWLDPQTRDKSVLSVLNDKVLSEVNIVVKHVNTWVVVNMSMLRDMASEESSYDPMFVQKLWLALLHRVTEISETTIYDNNAVKGLSANLTAADPVTPDEEDTEEEDELALLEELEEVLQEPTSESEEEDTEETVAVEMFEEEQEETVEEIAEEELGVKEPEEAIEEHLQEAIAEGTVSKAKAKKLIEEAKAALEAPSPYGDGTKVKDNLVVTEEDIKLDESAIKLPDTPAVLDDSMLESTLAEFDKKYVTKTIKKDTISCIHSVSNAGVVVSEHTVEENENVLGAYEEHAIKLTPVDGSPSTVKIKIPKVNEDGEFMISGNRYILRKQRLDYPIRKTAHNGVGLTSYFGKLFITRSKYKKNDAAYWVRKKLVEEFVSENSRISQLVGLPSVTPYARVPHEYELISGHNKNIAIGKDSFFYNYSEREDLLSDGVELKKVEANGRYVVAGRRGKTPIVMDFDNKYYLFNNGKYEPIKGPLEILEIDPRQAPLEIVTIKVFKQEVPVVFLLLYYMGFKKLAKLTNLKYRTVEADKRPNATDDEFVVKLKDKTLIIDKSDRVSMLLWSGLTYYKELKAHYLSDLNNKNTLFGFFSAIGLSPMVIREMALMNEMFVDPITLSILKERNEPTTFIGLLLKAVELLKDDFYKEQQDLTEMVVKGYERFPGLIYRNMVQAIREHRNKSLYSKSKIDMNPYAVWKDINEDSAKVPVDDINPIAYLKLSEELTYLGKGGRTREVMNKKSRAYHVSDVGVVSESSKDSGDVGISALMSANPKLRNLRGLKGEFDPKEDGFTSVLSTSALLAPGSIYDDPKRTVFVSIQNSHVVPIEGREPPYVRTGYETVLAHRLPKRFAFIATEDGEVTAVTKDAISVKYKSGKSDRVKLGKTPTKEETHTAYYILMYTDRDKGYKFKQGEVLAFDRMFFSRDLFDKTKVVYNAAKTVKTAMLEVPETHEDSCAFYSGVLGDLKTKVFKTKSIMLTSEQEVLEVSMPGDRLSVDDRLLIVENPGASLFKNLDEASAETLKSLKRQAPKAKLKGVVYKLHVFYNCELEELSPSLRELAEKSNKALQKELGKKDITGRVTSERSVDGRVMNEGDVEIKYYIEVEEPMGVGDKGIFANQMKTTIGSVYTDEVTTENGEIVEAMFGERSMQARIVVSPKMIGVTTTALKAITKEAIKVYKK